MKNRKAPRWAFHVDGPWSEDVRLYGAPLRIYAWIPAGHITIALWPGHEVQKFNNKTGRYSETEFTWFQFTKRKLEDE